RELGDVLLLFGAKLFVGLRPAREADDVRARRQQTGDCEVVERREQLALGEITGRAEDDDVARRGDAFAAEAFAERIRHPRRVSTVSLRWVRVFDVGGGP